MKTNIYNVDVHGKERNWHISKRSDIESIKEQLKIQFDLNQNVEYEIAFLENYIEERYISSVEFKNENELWDEMKHCMVKRITNQEHRDHLLKLITQACEWESTPDLNKETILEVYINKYWMSVSITYIYA